MVHASSPVPFANVPGTFVPVRKELDEAIATILDTGAFVQGKWCRALEAGFVDYLGVEAAVAVASGTSALELTLRALDVGPGDEVITTALTFIATAEAICATGATPVFADVNPKTLQVDAGHVAQLIGPKTVGILPVHLYGAPAPMGELARIAGERNLWIVEDTAQAHGARYRGERLGSLGIASCFSFYPGKNLGAAGEGGLVATRDPELAMRVSQLRDHGSIAKYYHHEIGVNDRMSEIEAASVALKLPLLDEGNGKRRAVAARYARGLAGLPLTIPGVEEGGESVHHLFVIQCADRDSLRAHLDSVGIQTGLHYPLPLHQQPALQSIVPAGLSLPHAENAAQSVLSLPMFPDMTHGQIDTVCRAIATYFAGRREVAKMPASSAMAA
ncbi:dTDP-3-amino-3,6-dideoxy-alpha-D-galactopyranose transaminase [Planctomycetes bacterium Poly30]|uniref:dTDP-3-amino-3,6-dideoxy-alpha-D-galactopyranose transaminase n=1 Tax=Saltatorellus ferox TaxID=2528018 RepID=A0A518ENU5_9BACT|nr:dTDP-3-amino-3,6-dideoxy-alpha-D-galactopyranose transaminase [Planctomycetes bacterium Poly30]